ncbi:hypothetical protein V8J88_25220 [Massilia sp. W12]|uniref:DNA/RNA non-specific endonuclease n=1 Tax=Massilia sp. W12 TaxID=3126507 RepID=UPI0030CE22C9
MPHSMSKKIKKAEKTVYHPSVGKGAAPTKASRKYVNMPSISIPTKVQVKLHYTSDSGVKKTKTYNFKQTIKPKMKWDAGHIQPAQLKGHGKQSNMFPQNKDFNRNSGKKGLAFIEPLGSDTSKHLKRKAAGKPATRLNRPKVNGGLGDGIRPMTYRDVEDKIARKAAKYPAGSVTVTHTRKFA